MASFAMRFGRFWRPDSLALLVSVSVLAAYHESCIDFIRRRHLLWGSHR